MLLNFAEWNNIKLDFSSIFSSLKVPPIDEKILLDFMKKFRKIHQIKPEKLEIQFPQMNQPLKKT